ncbi:FlgD immunoglobulin-like domain containing protein [candidate division KSB1 bacterium]
MKRVFVLFLAVGLLLGFGTYSYAQIPDVFIELETTYTAGISMSDTLEDVRASTPVYVSIYAKNLTKFISYDIRIELDKTKVMTGSGEYTFEPSVFPEEANALGTPFGSAMFSATEDMFSVLYTISDTEVGVDASDYVFLGRLSLVTAADLTTSDEILFVVKTAKFLQGTPRTETTAFTANWAVINPDYRPTIVFIDDDYTSGNAGGHTWNYDAFADITTGITSIAPRGTVIVAAGAYTEDITFNKSAKFTGAGIASVTITGSHKITANDVFIDGFTFDLASVGTVFTISTYDAEADISGISFENNAFDITNSASIGIWFGNSASYAVSDIIVDMNTFTGSSEKIAKSMQIGGDYLTPLNTSVSDLIISNNNITSCSIIINLQDTDLTDITIDGNTFSNTNGCVYMWGAGTITPPIGILSNFKFTKNTIESTNSFGLAIGFDPSLAPIFTDANFGTGNVVRQNTFALLPDTTYGLRSVTLKSNVLTYKLNAVSNWWGNTTGPQHSSNAAGTGAWVSDNVTFEPWYSDALMTTLGNVPEDIPIIQEITENTQTFTNNFADNTSIVVDFKTGELKGLELALTKVSNIAKTTVPAEKISANIAEVFAISLSADASFEAYLTFGYDDTALPVGADEDSLTAAYFDDTAGDWVIVPATLDKPNKKVKVTTTHFSVWAIVDKNDGVITGIKPIEDVQIPDDFRLDDNYPNPFNPTTTIPFQLAKSEIITLRVYNTSGQLVKTLINNELTGAGSYKVYWDGTNEAGQKVGSGIYLYILQARTITQTKKMILIK